MSRLPLFTQAQSRITRVLPPLQRCQPAALPAEHQVRAQLLQHLADQQPPIKTLPQVILAQKTAYWNTVIPYSRLIPSKTAQLHVSQTPAAFLLHSYPVKAHAIHRFTRLRTLHMLECSSITFTTTIGIVIRVRRNDPEQSQQYRRGHQRL